ncbi:MAG: nucleotidyltransferase domain-containing protein [Candidatus Moeniiplasma glomeromycotorum]|nr:nucleotidyltransferase domain-containing protein [Candidatus Moeniiplasma glomeromycotorum]MCE8168098.1 nucleotidyltransferase domain-containing protein [Candidatus Moeniiplasma glomeromycotorum]MCE8169642.1 nucleotidyltransferase domain-containing protein [Candidatus Moeniiplasma glomeromycotorum]
MLQIENKHWKIVQNILSKYPYQFYAYGSRVKSKARKLSDLDICYYDNIPDELIFQIKEEFSQSNLPFFVEIVAWKNMRPAFQKAVEKDLMLIFSPPSFQDTQ